MRKATLDNLVAACEMACAHTDELRDAWMRGALSSHDGRNGQRSNMNVDVEVKLRNAMQAFCEEMEERAKPLSTEWLLSSAGWKRVAYKGIRWPSVILPSRELLQWRAAGMWIGETPIVLTTNRGQVLDLMDALGAVNGC